MKNAQSINTFVCLKGRNDMLHPDTIVHCIDTETRHIHVTQICKLFQLYSHKMEKIDEDDFEIKLEPGTLKVKDLLGWTDVTSIRKLLGINQRYWGVFGIPPIPITVDTLIPVFDVEKPIHGFHGDIRYKWWIKELMNLNDSDFIKIRDPRSKLYHFMQVRSFREINRWTFSHSVDDLKEVIRIAHDYSPDLVTLTDFAYQIFTKSGFYNVGSLYLWGKESIPEDYCSECSVNDTFNCVRCRKTEPIEYSPDLN